MGNKLAAATKVRCTKCHSLSLVTEEALGGEAKCPFCETIFVAARVNEPEESLDPKAKHPLMLGKLDPAVALKLSWEISTANLLILFVLFVAHLVYFWLVAMLWAAIFDSELPFWESVALLVGIPPAVMWLNIGLTKVTLQLARGIPTPAETVFSGLNRLVRVMIFNFVFSIIIAIGSIAFIVPGVFLMLRFWSGTYFIIDRNCSVSEAFQLASQFSEWNKVSSLQLGCISLGLAVLSFVCFFGFGLLFVLPFINFMWTIAYMMMTRQPIQRPVPAT